jgi:hypothetical protein
VAGAYVNDPSSLKVKVPCVGVVSKIGWSVRPWGSVSFERIPGAGTKSVVFSGVV